MEYREFRADVAEDSGKLSGLAAPFGSETTIGRIENGGWREEIAPGAFAKALRESDTVLLCDHDMSKPLARVSAGTLRLRESGKGLEFDADPADTSYGRDLQINVRAKNKGGMSIGFEPVKDEWFHDDGRPATRLDGTRRILREVKLPELSCVTNPAYKDTSVFARDDSAALLEERAAKATYADLETCGECGATGQYGGFCSSCGKPMKQSKPSGDFCTSCGAKLDSKNRASHECEEKRAAKPYGNVPYADPKNGKYPIDQKHVKAAWGYINQAKNAAKYPLNGVTLSSVKAKIKAAMKKFGFTSGSAGERFEFVDAEWRDDDPYFDEWYEIDDADEGDDTEETSGDSREQEPDTSTPENEDESLALRMRMHSREIELELI